MQILPHHNLPVLTVSGALHKTLRTSAAIQRQVFASLVALLTCPLSLIAKNMGTEGYACRAKPSVAMQAAQGQRLIEEHITVAQNQSLSTGIWNATHNDDNQASAEKKEYPPGKQGSGCPLCGESEITARRGCFVLAFLLFFSS